MSGFPTSFHLGPLVFHTYGLGLALAAYVAYFYSEKRLVKAGISVTPFGRYTAWLLVSGLIGARLANIATNWSYYAGHFGRWISVWQGGLASFGGIALAIPFGLYFKRRYWPDAPMLSFLDALIPALVAGWAVGRFLGPQFMVDGGGHLTHQWFGMHYVGQIGRRVPVPLIQGLEDAALWLVLLGVEKWRRLAKPGLITGLGLLCWGVVRALDERLLLGQQSHSGSVGVQLAGLVLSVIGLIVLVSRGRKIAR